MGPTVNIYDAFVASHTCTKIRESAIVNRKLSLPLPAIYYSRLALLMKDVNVQECDATKVQFICNSRVQKK